MLLVDAFNVVRAQWVLPTHRRGMDVRGLIRLIGRSRFATRRLRVVVDGNPGPEWVRHGVLETQCGMAWTRFGRGEVVFSGRGREADDVIEDILARDHAFDITVVSSDRRLVRAAGLAGADQIGNGSFLRLLNEDLDRAGDAPKPAFAAEVPLDRESIAHWMRAFGYDPPETPPAPTPERAAQPAAPPQPIKPPRPAFGTAISIELPPSTPNPARSSGHAGDPSGGSPPPPTDHAPVPIEPLDPLLREAFAEWAGRLSHGDLDMRRWIEGVEPL